MFLDGNGSSFLFDKVDHSMLGNPRHSWILDFRALIPDSRYWIPVFVSRTWIMGSKCDLVRFRILELYSGFRGSGFRNPQAKISRITETRFTVYIRWGWGRPKIAHCMKLGTLRCHDGDDNENVKKAIGWMSKTTTLHVHHAFLYISLPSLHDYDGKMPNFTFYGGRKQATAKFSVSFWTWIWFLGIRLKKSLLAFHKVNEFELCAFDYYFLENAPYNY